MKIQVFSDLHLEHGGPVPPHHPEAGVIVLAGDLAPLYEGTRGEALSVLGVCLAHRLRPWEPRVLRHGDRRREGAARWRMRGGRDPPPRSRHGPNRGHTLHRGHPVDGSGALRQVRRDRGAPTSAPGHFGLRRRDSTPWAELQHAGVRPTASGSPAIHRGRARTGGARR